MRRLILFAKRPRLGEVKTRLVPSLTPGQALGLYNAFLADQIAFIEQFAEDRAVEICSDQPWTEAERGIRLTLQGAGDLGERMLRAFERSHAEGSKATVIIGADCPTLPAKYVERAFESLESGADAVISPADDGGYVLVGLARPRAELFRNMPWGSADVMAVTRAEARKHGILLEEIEGWYDIDDIRGVRRLAADPSLLSRAPVTARCLESLAL
jgi:rSAM/selenodomain-associated transferase 1